MPLMSAPRTTVSGEVYFLVLRGFKNAAQRHHFPLAVRDFKADEGATGDDFNNAHTRHREEAGDVTVKVGDGADFDAGGEREFDAGNDRADGDVFDAHAEFVVFSACSTCIAISSSSSSL